MANGELNFYITFKEGHIKENEKRIQAIMELNTIGYFSGEETDIEIKESVKKVYKNAIISTNPPKK